jgi:CheY-like chemotaxis protein
MKRILIVSSDRHLLRVLDQEFSRMYYNVLIEFDPHRTCAHIREFAPDLLIVDLILNDYNGGAISHQVKSDPLTRDLPIIILSDYELETHYPARFGCDRVVQKSEEIQPLIDSVNDLFEENESVFS